MKTFVLSVLCICILSFTLISCNSPQGNTSNTNKGPVTNANSNSGSNSNANAAKTSANLSSPTATLTAFYEGMKSKNEEQVKSTFSKAALAELEEPMKQANATSLIGFFDSQNPPPDKLYDNRNETIDGDSATLEIRDPKRSIWVKCKYVKEDGVWKVAARSEILKLNPELAEELKKEDAEKAKNAAKNMKTAPQDSNSR